MGAVRRLNATWKNLPEQSLKTFQHLDALLNTDENWKNYREVLKTVKIGKEPSFPYLGIHILLKN